ncbi:hypothetical protein Poli38472_004496 [Pythium oligandrum]|uniref:EGF-like domain-containing protein n=1 Tax=Pythium oligandrum TaxID=41045 RepID=A0A8K1CBQ0_PYTOL|nr:hypothetical protein Poli38472_004496 [Pythium oligandrum]|eukprot:TMW59427.1 hypothetical protein Poli38472_004496 [Pythium oligandrum]
MWICSQSPSDSVGGKLAMRWLVLLAFAHAVGGCIHDQIKHQVPTTNVQEYSDNHPFVMAEARRQRKLQGLSDDLSDNLLGTQDYDRVMGQEVDSSSYSPIRIVPYYDNTTLDLLTPEKRAIIFKILPDAIRRFQLTLSVVPVVGNLKAQRTCYVQWKTTPAVCKDVAPSERCLEMPMPDSHFTAMKTCSTCLATGCTVGDCSTTKEGTGVANADFMLYVRAANSSYCTGPVLAYASSCQKDQYDRPTFGMANFCPEQIKTDPRQYQSQLSTAMHEITHALGFSSLFFPYMRNSDGTPRTARNSDGRPPAQANVQCPNGQTASLYVAPSSNTVKFSSERDTSVARMVTPRVAAFVQSHFGCSSLTGAELENNEEGCLGSHWEERIFEPEYMTPISSFRNVLSPLTLAFFEDSGWYKANATMGERLIFGNKQGCAFATSKCIDKASGVSVASDHFCTSNDAESCSVDANSRSVCTISSGLSIPKPFQYFSDPSKGGINDYADYCPINTGFSYGDCSDPTNLVMPTGTTINILGETYCPTCKCTRTTLRSSDSKKWVVNARRKTGCYAMRCRDSSTVDIDIPVVGSTTQVVTRTCTQKGQILTVDGYSGSVTCPDPLIVCDRSCPGACSGNGVCDFGTAKCTCSNGWSGEDCSKNTATTTSNLRTDTASRMDQSVVTWLLLGLTSLMLVIR